MNLKMLEEWLFRRDERDLSPGRNRRFDGEVPPFFGPSSFPWELLDEPGSWNWLDGIE